MLLFYRYTPFLLWQDGSSSKVRQLGKLSVSVTSSLYHRETESHRFHRNSKQHNKWHNLFSFPFWSVGKKIEQISDVLSPFSVFCSSSSKHRKNVISCVTVHDSPDSDCSSHNSPYNLESRPHNHNNNNNNYDTKTAILDNYNNGNPRTIIIPPLKTQHSEAPSECEWLKPGNACFVSRTE